MSDSPRIEFETLHQTQHWDVQVAYRARIIRLQRTEVPFSSVQEVNDSFAEINRQMDRFPLRSWGLLFDVRRLRPIHDTDIEKAFRENRRSAYEPFARYGVLVATAAGQMQVRRMLKETPDPRIEVFLDESAAVEWVRAKDESPSIPVLRQSHPPSWRIKR
jgi:hypothetical protein